MYLSQSINVYLTEENSAILKRPSKVFNKIRALFSGTMTPTEAKQAEVMLSVLQRLNVAFRKSGFSNLVSISVNGQNIYEDAKGDNQDLEQGNASLIENFESGDITKVNSLCINVDGEDEILRYLIHVNIVRRPKKDRTPVQVTVFGFLKAFKQQKLETDDAFSIRIKSILKEQWGTQMPKKLAQIESQFLASVEQIQQQVNIVFPEKSSLEKVKTRHRQSPLKVKNTAVQHRYDDSYAYLPIWFIYFGDNDPDAVDDFELDESVEWELDSPEFDGSDTSSWTDSVSFGDSGASDTSSSCSSGCGSSCGGGCGGG